MADDSARRDVPPDERTTPPPTGPAWPVWPDRRADPGWPVYGSAPHDPDGPDDAPPATPWRPTRSLLVAGVTLGVVIAAVGLSSVSRTATSASAPVRVDPAPVRVDTGPQWTQADASLTAGLVRVQVTANVEADGMVMTDDGLVATSYARLVGLNGTSSQIAAVELRVVADGGMPMTARVIGFDAARDIAVLRVPGYTPASVARVGGAVRKGDTLTLLDDQGGDQPVMGHQVTVIGTGQRCSRVGAEMIGRPRGFTFGLELALAEPGGAVVRDDGTVVGLHYGDASVHCAVPIRQVDAVVRAVAAGEETGTTRVGPAGGLGLQLVDLDDSPYPEVFSVGSSTGLADAGLRPGDHLTRVAGVSLRESDLTAMGPDGILRSLEPGQRVAVEWLSDGVTHTARVRVGTGPTPHG